MASAAILTAGASAPPQLPTEPPSPTESPSPNESPSPADGSSTTTGPKRARSFAEFKPSRDGFAFVNHFSGRVLPAALGPLGGLINMNGFGLCGGMSFAAADCFLSNTRPPLQSSQPVTGSSLREYLHERQLDSLGGLTAGLPQISRFTGWMRAPRAGLFGTAQLSAAGLGELLAKLDAGEPAVLGLVLVRSKSVSAPGPVEPRAQTRDQSGAQDDGPVGDPWDNHQVLACSYRRAPGGTIAVRVYDPNYPKNDRVEIILRPRIVGAVSTPGPIVISTPILGLVAERVVPSPGKAEPNRRAVRGVFVMPYYPKAPVALGGN